MIKNTFNYESPEVKVMEIIAEGVLCESGETTGTGSFEMYDEINCVCSKVNFPHFRLEKGTT